MGFFSSKKQKVNLKEFCRLYYDNVILNPKDITNAEYPETFKKQIIELLPEFRSVSLEKIKEELRNLIFELFALSWVHNLGEDFAIEQSIFTKKYLYEKGKDDIWEGMCYYNKYIAHSVNVGTGGSYELNKVYATKSRMDLFDKYASVLEKNGMVIDDSWGLAINRIFSEKVWERRSTHYFLMLALCSKFGLGSGKEYLGPDKKVQSGFVSAIAGIYSGMSKYFDKIEIES